MSATLAGTAVREGERAQARFEFRSFGQQFDAVQRRLEALTAPLPEGIRERHSDEVYIISRESDVHNVKLRDGKLDIKTWIRSFEGLEQWEPLVKLTFPLSRATLRSEVFPALGVAPPDLPVPAYDVAQFLALVRAQPALAAVRVHKQRFGYFVHGTICEYAVVLINGARVVSVSTESTDVTAIRRVIEATGMAGLENISYLQAIKRVIGMNPAPLAN